MIKILGYVITYKPKDKHSRTLFNNTLYGRLMYKKRGDSKIAYYVPGILDNIKFAKLMQARIFVETIEGIDISLLELFGAVHIEMCDRDETTIGLRTGKEYWMDIAKEKEVHVRPSRVKRI